MPAQSVPTWTQHIDLIVPGVVFLGKTLIAVISFLGSLLIAVIIWLGKQVNRKMNSMDSKLDLMHDAMLSCEGCKEALARIAHQKRRATDELD